MSGVETELGQTDDDDATGLTAEAETDRHDSDQLAGYTTMEFLPGIMRRLAFPTAACLGSLDGTRLEMRRWRNFYILEIFSRCSCSII